MKHFVILLLAGSLLVSCKNDKTSKDKYEREKTEKTDGKDDYQSSDKKDDGESKSKTDDVPRDERGSSEDNSGGWSRSDENKFLDECKGTATPNVGAARAVEYCECVLGKLKNMYSSYNSANADMMGEGSSAKLQRLADQCNGK